MTTISALPSPPSTSDPVNFATEADAFIAALPTFVTETNTVAGEVNTNAATATTKAAEALASANNAAASTAFAMCWNFDSSTTMADPGAGDLRLNNATLASVTAIAVSANSADTGNPDVSDAVVTWDDSTNTSNRGTLTLRKIGTPGTFVQYAITGAVTDNTAWLQLTVTYITGNGSFSNADGLAVGFARTGDQGSTTGGNLSTALNYARATVASAATTADIWAATGNQIDWTGTTTCTGFPAAPQAGAERVLITAGAAPFTASANMLIDGVTSGNTYTCAAGDKVTVLALATTQFKLTIQKADGTAVVASSSGAGDHCVDLHTGNGHGSTNTKIRRFTTAVTNTGTAITYADSAANGASFTINTEGLYSITYTDRGSSVENLGISVNSSQLTTGIATITAANRLAATSISVANTYASVSIVTKLAVNDVVRPHDEGSLNGTDAMCRFTIRRIGNV